MFMDEILDSSSPSSINGTNRNGEGQIVKICRVCGDRALGFNFNGLTCESCKSFFRRNAARQQSYKCSKDGTCPIDFVTRKCCTRCRLDKCFRIGMKAELICSKLMQLATRSSSQPKEDPTSQIVLDQSLLNNNNNNSPSFSSVSSSSSSSSCSSINGSSLNHLTSTSSSSTALLANTNANLSEICQTKQPVVFDLMLEHHIRGQMTDEGDNDDSNSKGEKEEHSKEHIKLPMKSMKRNKRTKKDSSLVKLKTFKKNHSAQISLSAPEALSLEERQLLAEVERATDAAAFYDENRLQVVGEVTDLMYALNLAELYIRKTIRFCKSVAAFRLLTTADQLVVLKGFFTELMIVRFAFVFSPERDGYPVIEDEARRQAVLVRLSLLYESKRLNEPGVLHHCRAYSRRFHAELENDCTVRDLILAQRLFHPRPGLSCPEFIAYQHSLYRRLLVRHLETKLGDKGRAAEKVSTLGRILTEMAPVKEVLEGLFVQSDANQLALVLGEIYNLK